MRNSQHLCVLSWHTLAWFQDTKYASRPRKGIGAASANGCSAQVTPTRVQLCLMDALLREREAFSQDFAPSSAPHTTSAAWRITALCLHRACMLACCRSGCQVRFLPLCGPLRFQPAGRPPGSCQPMQVAEGCIWEQGLRAAAAAGRHLALVRQAMA